MLRYGGLYCEGVSHAVMVQWVYGLVAQSHHPHYGDGLGAPAFFSDASDNGLRRAAD